MKTGLVWFKDDLRLHDNEALTKAIEECDELIFCYAIERSNFDELDLGFKKCDINHYKFLEHSVLDLQNHLDKLGGHLLIGLVAYLRAGLARLFHLQRNEIR